jgi:hypothetical protein
MILMYRNKLDGSGLAIVWVTVRWNQVECVWIGVGWCWLRIGSSGGRNINDAHFGAVLP